MTWPPSVGGASLVTSRHDTYGVVAALGRGESENVVMAPAGRGSPCPTIQGHQGELTEREVEVGCGSRRDVNKLVGEHLGLQFDREEPFGADRAKLGTGDPG